MVIAALEALPDSALGFRVRVRRVARLLTQQELAEMAGITTEELVRVETGASFSAHSARRLMSQLGMTSGAR